MGERVPSNDRSRDPGSQSATAGDLIERVARGDQAAFAGLYDQFAGSVLGVITRVVRNPAYAEEVSQEVMLEAWQKAPRYAVARGSVQSWVLTIAHRRAVDRVRSEQAAQERDQREHVLAEQPFDEVTEAIVNRLERERVQHCLSSLTELQRESVTMAYYSGHTYREVAELLHTPLGTVKTRLRDGLIRLRDCLGVGR
ncbi:ECF RNA polymerase sigma factor SigK [Sciscionella marina]|uniref:ECF RNA polymerase sigma factor SigK n=1 Tax=Sciscionella marina TaxID=508770 RepID=UPI000371AED5|nr:ECF RNA polymerase sigma factor SigK [Sciscionella marina]